MLNQRERILMIAVLTIAGGYALFLLAHRAFFGPVAAQAAAISKLTDDLAAKDKQVQQAFDIRKKLSKLEEISLPTNDAEATTVYGGFLWKLLQDSKIEEPSLTPGPGKTVNMKAKGYTRIPFTIGGKASVESLTDLLYRFYEPNLLQQVRRLTINTKSGSGKLDITLEVEGLSLHSAAPRNELLPKGAETGGRIVDGKSRNDFKLIAQKNIFAPYQAPVTSTPTIERPKQPEIDAMQFVVFVGAPAAGDGFEAMFYDQIKPDHVTLLAGDEFDLAGVKGKVIAIDDRQLLFEAGGKQWSLALGKRLLDRKLVKNLEPDAAVAEDGDKPASETVAKTSDTTDKKPDSTEPQADSPNGDPDATPSTEPDKTAKDKPDSAPSADETP